jgi:protein-disulfide isomerase
VNRWTPALVALIGVGAGAIGMSAWSATRPVADRGAMEQVVHDYLMAHPEVIPAAMQRLQQREASRAATAAGSAITRPYAGAWAGNPRGDVTVVEYYDYNCGYCRASLPILRRLIAGDPNVRVVFRELPVLAESSRAAAEASLAAATQGTAKFNRFHEALYAAGRVTDASIAAAARAAGVDLAKADKGAASAEITRNMETAARLGLNGTPSWIIGNRVFSGAAPLEELQKAVAAARGR